MSLTKTSTVADGTVAFVTLETARTLKAICSHNHLGASYFDQGKYSDAMLCFKEATFAAKTLVIEQEGKPHEEHCWLCHLQHNDVHQPSFRKQTSTVMSNPSTI
jgi:hypothetical protein